MAEFNLPFGVRVSNSDPLDAGRYIAADIATRDLLVTNERAYVGLQVYVDPSLYILKSLLPAVWSVLSDASITANYLKNTTDTFTGILTLDGSLVINGDIIQDGSSYETHAEQIYTKDDFIIMRDGAITALTDGSISGIEVTKPDGVHNVILGTGNDAIMRVGWEGDGSTLQALATREDIPGNDEYAYWNDSSTMFKTHDLKSDLDSSFGLYETKVNLNTTFGLYETKIHLDSSFGLYETKVNLNTTFGLYETKVHLDSSFGLYETKVHLDSSFGLYETKVHLDSSFGLYQTIINLNTLLNAKASTTHGSTHITGGSDIIPIATNAAIGLLPILSNSSSQYLNGVGNWTTPTGSVTSVAAGSGMNFTTITATGSITMGTPSDISTNSTNLAGGKTHSHNLNIPAKDFTSGEVTNLRGAKLDDGTTPWVMAASAFNATEVGYLRGAKLDDGTTPWVMAASAFNATEVGYLRDAKLDDGTTPWVMAASAFNATEVGYLRDAKLDDGTTPWVMAASAFNATEVGYLRDAKLDDGTTPWTTKLEDTTDTFTGRLDVDGSIFVTNYVTATDFILASDKRLKDNIQPFIGLDTALKFEPITHTWKNKGDKKHVGFIAQDVEKICNTLVSEDPDGFKGISYSKITVINNAAIHELFKKIEILEEKIKKLENKK